LEPIIFVLSSLSRDTMEFDENVTADVKQEPKEFSQPFSDDSEQVDRVLDHLEEIFRSRSGARLPPLSLRTHWML